MQFHPNEETFAPLPENADPRSIRSTSKNVSIKILEQPIRLFKYRYKTDWKKRSPGNIYGENSCREKITYPTIQVVNYAGPSVVVVSCVTKDVHQVESKQGYLTHPHNLVGTDCKDGVCRFQAEGNIISFPHIAIERVKEEEIKASLKARRDCRIDPYGMGFDHDKKIDLRAVRLCFQVFIARQTDNYARIVSEPIYNKDVVSDLKIATLNPVSASVKGSEDLIILCPRANDGVEVWFFEEGPSKTPWAAKATIKYIFKKVAIVCTVPPFYNPSIAKSVKVLVQLRHPAEDITGDAREFYYIAQRKSIKPLLPSFITANRFPEEAEATIFVPRTKEKRSYIETDVMHFCERPCSSNATVSKTIAQYPTWNEWWERYILLQQQQEFIKQELSSMEQSLQYSTFSEKATAGQAVSNEMSRNIFENDDLVNSFKNLSTEDIIVDKEFPDENVSQNFVSFDSVLENFQQQEKESKPFSGENVTQDFLSFGKRLENFQQQEKDSKPFSEENVTQDFQSFGSGLENFQQDKDSNAFCRSNSNLQGQTTVNLENEAVLKEMQLLEWFANENNETMEIESIRQNLSDVYS